MVGMGVFFVAFLLVVGVCTKVHAFSGKKCFSLYFALYFCWENLKHIVFVRKIISPRLSEFLRCQLGALIHGLHIPLSQKAGLLGTPPAFMTHSPFD